MISIALIDDHHVVRSGFAQLLELQGDFQVVAEFASGNEALEKLPQLDVRVCICDIAMPEVTGTELIAHLPKSVAVIMLSMYDSEALIRQCLKNGAMGFISKRCSPYELFNAIRTVAQGGCYLSPDLARKLASCNSDTLTKREFEVAGKIVLGMTVKQIAAELNLSPKTVHIHRSSLLSKLDVRNDIELIRKLYGTGL